MTQTILRAPGTTHFEGARAEEQQNHLESWWQLQPPLKYQVRSNCHAQGTLSRDDATCRDEHHTDQ